VIARDDLVVVRLIVTATHQGTKIRSAGSTVPSAASGVATAASLTGSPKNWPKTPPCRRPTASFLTVPSQLGVEYNAQMLDTIAREVAPAFGWKPESASESASPNLR
jgi:hypothetical protein